MSDYRILSANLEPWRIAWRAGFAPVLSTPGLLALAAALQCKSHALITGSTILPPPLSYNAKEPVEKCCPIAYAALDGYRPYEVNVEWAEERFAQVCYEASTLLGDPEGPKYLLCWLDEGKPEEVFAQLLAEVTLALTARSIQLPAAA